MAIDWEPTFQQWSKPVSTTEEEKCANTERMIRNAIDLSTKLNTRNIEVFVQGSYKNCTNIRLDSDVDICVVCKDIFFSDFSQDNSITQKEAGIIDSDYTYSQFKNEVEDALVNKFGRDMVKRGSEAFDIHASSYRVDADVIPCFEHRMYYRNSSGQIQYLLGVELRPDNGGRIINWPKQHFHNGVDKDQRTGGNFKRSIRVIKNLRNELQDNSIVEAKDFPSFLIECLIWNVNSSGFAYSTFSSMIRHILAETYNATLQPETCKEWTEVNGIKYLFHFRQPWTLTQAHSFLNAAWNYLGFV